MIDYCLIKYLVKSNRIHSFGFMKNEKKKGGKRSGAGRKPSKAKKEPITVYADISRFGSKEGARMAIYEFLDGKITPTGKTAFISLDFPKASRVKSKKESLKDLTPAAKKEIIHIPINEIKKASAASVVDVDLLAQISELEKELKSEPKNPLIGIRAWRKVRQDKIQELKNQLKQ
jgi:biopolymer transport protein ExbD